MVTVNTSIYIINLQLIKTMLRFVPKVLVSAIDEVKLKSSDRYGILPPKQVM